MVAAIWKVAYNDSSMEVERYFQKKAKLVDKPNILKKKTEHVKSTLCILWDSSAGSKQIQESTRWYDDSGFILKRKQTQLK